MSDTEYEEKIEKVVLVACLFCERQSKFQFLNYKDAYPVSLLINQWMQNPQLQTPKLQSVYTPAWLCKKHYEQAVNGGVDLNVT